MRIVRGAGRMLASYCPEEGRLFVEGDLVLAGRPLRQPAGPRCVHRY